MGLWNKVKSWFKKTFSGGNSSKSTSRSNYRSPSQRTYTSSSGSYSDRGSDRYFSRADELRQRREEQKRKREERERNRKRLEIYKAKDTNYKSMAQDAVNNAQSVTKSLESAVKKTPPTRRQNIENVKAFKNTKATVDDEYAITSAGKKAIGKVREQKEADKQKYKLTDKDYKTVEKQVPNMDDTGKWDGTYKTVKVKELTDKGYEKKLKGDKTYNAIETIGREGLKGVSWGTSELLFKKLMDDSAEKTYQKNKNKALGTTASIAGSLYSFNSVGKGATNLSGKMAGTKAGQKLTAKLAEKKLVQASAKRAVNKAVKKGLIKEGGEELVKKTAQEKANKLVQALGQDAIINATAGATMDISEATANHKVGTKDWWKTLGKNAALNWGLGGAIALPTSGAIGKKSAVEAYENLVKTDAAKRALRARFGKIEPPTVSVKRSVKNATGIDISKPMSDTDIGTLRTMRDNLADSLRREPQGSEQAKSLTQKLKNIDRVLKRVDGVEGVARNSDEAVESVAKNSDNLTNRLTREDIDARKLSAGEDGTMPRSSDLMTGDDGVLRKQDDISYSLNRKRKTNVRITDSAENATRSSDEVAETIRREADELQTLKRDLDKLEADKKARRISPQEYEDRSFEIEERINAIESRQKTLAEEFEGGAQRTIKDEIGEPTAPRTEDGDLPYAMADEGAEGINPDTPLDDLRARAQEIADGDDAFTRGASESATRGTTEEVSEGQRLAREAHFEKTGVRVENGRPHATDEQILDALGKYERSQGESTERALSRYAYSQIKVSDTDTAKIIDDLIDKGSFSYSKLNQKKMYEEVAKDLNDNSQLWIDKLGSIADGGDWSGREQTKLLYMAQYLSEITDATKSPEQEALATMTWKATQKLLTSSAQTMNGRSMYARLSRAGKMESALDDLVDMLGSSIGFKHKHRKALRGLNNFEREHFIKGELLKDDAIKKYLSNLADAKTNDEISEAYTELLYQFNKHHPKSAFDVVQELRYLNMLGNPKTHIRNVFGSAFFSPMRQTSNAIRSGIEEGIASWASKQAGETLEITRHGGFSATAVKEAWTKNPTTEAGKSALEAFERLKPDILGSVKYDTPMYKGRAKTFMGKGLDTLADFNSTILTKEDDFFRSRAFKENYIKSYNRYLKDGKPITEKVKRQIEAEAIRESQIATFNEYNAFAQWLTNITKNATDANASIGARWTARGVNAVMPFAKVPANLAKQSINYSPLGLARGMAGIKKAARTGDATLLNEAIDQLSSGITGTGVFGLGMLLGKTTDMFTTNAGKNDPAAKFKKGQGMQNYSINFVDPETGKGHSFTLDWLVPTASTFFSGLELSNQLQEGDFNLLDIGGDWATVMSRLAEPVMETSMLSGLNGMLETMRSGYNGDDEVGALHILARETAQSYMNSLIPTLVGQAARTAYKSDMQITGNDDWEYFRNSLKSKAGLANTKILGEELGADTDLFGNVKNDKGKSLIEAIRDNDKEALGKYGVSALKNFLSPSNIQKIDLSEVDRAKLAEYEERVKNGEDPSELAYMFPKKQYKKQFNVGGEDVQLTNRELSLYNQAKTTGGSEGMRYVLDSIIFNRYGKDDKGKRTVLLDGYTEKEKARLIKEAQNWSMREVEQWLWDNPKFQKASEAEQKKVIRDLWNLNKQGKAVASQRVGERAVYEAQGRDVNEYDFKNEVSDKKRDALQDAIDSGLITYEEAVDFARHAGKTYHYEDDEGGTSKTYYNKSDMIDYLVSKGYSYEKAEVLYNAFKSGNAKAFSGFDKSSGRKGYRRRGYRRYRRRGRSRKTAVPKSTIKINAKAYKPDVAKTKSMAEGLPTGKNAVKIKAPKTRKSATTKSSLKTAKITPPKVKMNKYEV